MTRRTIFAVFAVAAAYDGLLGMAFLLAPGSVFARFGVQPPNHPGYVQFPAALLLVFALMFIAIARDPVGRRDLMPYGMLLKLSYCGVVFWHWLAGGIPNMWKPFAMLDLAFLLLFAWAYAALAPARHHI